MCDTRNLQVATIASKHKFDMPQNVLKEKCDVKHNPTAADEHVAEVECMIQVVKERIWASCNQMPWKKAIPKLTIRETVKIPQ